MAQPFPVPSRPSRKLQRARAYWRRLLRGAADMPFADDLNLTALPDLADCLLLIDVFERPQRFRLNTLGKALGHSGLSGRFIDELDPPTAFPFLGAQCSATVETAAPTGFRQAAAHGAPACQRLLLPLWADGRISLLLGVVDPG